jgi:hypothetical protein
MKFKIVFLLLLTSKILFAQLDRDPNPVKWQIGARMGGSLLPEKNELEQNQFKIGFNGGINTHYKINKYWGLKAEFNFSQKGKAYSFNDKQSLFSSFNQIISPILDTSIIGAVQGFVDDGVYSSYKGYHKLGYLEMPILAELTFYKFKFTAGPYVGLLVQAYTKESLDQNIPLLDLISPAIDSLGIAAFLIQGLIDASFPGYNQTEITESTESSSFTKVNYGFLAQISYQIHQNLYLEARYSRALNNYLIQNANNAQLSTFTLSLAYNFDLKRLKK